MMNHQHTKIKTDHAITYFASPFQLIPYSYPIYLNATQLAITCSKLTIETLEQGMKYVQI